MPSFNAVETAVEIGQPVAQKLAATASAKLSEFAGSLLSGEGDRLGQLLPHRRFLRRESGSSALAAIPAAVDWQMRKSELSKAISGRIEQQRLTEQEFWQPIRSFSKEDRPIVARILERSASSSTDIGLLGSFESVANKLRSQFPGEWEVEDAHMFAASASSSGNMLAYLFGKSLGSGRRVNYFELGKHATSDLTEPVFLFDDPRHLNAADRALLRDFQTKQPVVAVDVSSFERTLNFIDFAHGQPAVLSKLNGLLTETKLLIRAEPNLSHEEAVKRILYQDFDQSVQSLNRESRPGARPIEIVRSDPVAPATAFARTITPEQVTSYLEDRFHYSSDERIFVAELLAENIEFPSLGSMIPKLKSLEEALRFSAQQHKIEPANDLFVMASEGVGSSDAFMTYLYRQATALPKERIVTLERLNALQREGKVGGNRIVALDDAIYAGQQADSLLAYQLEPYPHVALGNLSSSASFARQIHGGEYAKDGIRELVTLQNDFPLNAVSDFFDNDFFNRMSAAEQQIVKWIAPVDGIDNILTLSVFPHMLSDTTAGWLSRFARQFPLTFEHGFAPRVGR